MAASFISPQGGMSDLDQPSSPPVARSHSHGGQGTNGIAHEQSFATNLTDDEDTRMGGTPDPSEGLSRRRKRDTSAQNKENVGKVKHLKKDDGEPLWRKDIQYDFLKAVFDDDRKVFTNSYEKDHPPQCFADLYIDTMSRSSKTSKVLRDKLLSDREAAKGMAMVCLLVNIGRMNTTLNFFPEMRAQLRTYHAIPSLQAYQDPNQYKQLQDAPRLKSILKGGTDDRLEPQTLDKIKARNVPRTNPVNLIFVICAAASKVAELHFPAGREFHDLVMRTNFSSSSRARAFLWIMWFYLESDFTEEGCEENPFGAGVDYGLDVANQGVPRLEEMTPEEEEAENIDPPVEIEFGLEKKAMRARIIEADQALIAESQNKRPGVTAVVRSRTFLDDTPGPTSGILPRIRPPKHDSDLESFASTPPPRTLGPRSGPLSLAGTVRRGGASLKYAGDASSPGVHGLDGINIPARKPRPPTAHQIAVERNRTERVEHILDRGIRKAHHKSRKARRSGGSTLMRTLDRLGAMENPFEDSEGEEIVKHNYQILANAAPDDPRNPFRERGMGGIVALRSEPDDFGEEAASYAASLRRMNRRLRRWEDLEDPEAVGVIPPIKRPRIHHSEDEEEDDDHMDTEMIDPAETEDEAEVLLRRVAPKPRGPRAKTNGGGARRKANTNGHAEVSTPQHNEEELDDVEKELLAEADDGDIGGDDEDDDRDLPGAAPADKDRGEDEEDELDDMDKTLLGYVDSDGE